MTMRLVNSAITFDWLSRHFDGAGSRIAVVDSGIDARHAELSGSVVDAVSLSEEDMGIALRPLAADACNDGFGHGTAVASVIRSIAPGAELVDVRVLNEFNACSGEVLIAGLRWCIDQGLPLVNVSLATIKAKYRLELIDLCEKAYTQGTILVASKRNFGPIGFPAEFSNVISVDRESYPELYRVNFRPRDQVEFDARGVNIRVAAPGGGYTEMTGTSFATPHVTAYCALLRQAFPDILPFELKAVLKKLSRDFAPDV